MSRGKICSERGRVLVEAVALVGLFGAGGTIHGIDVGAVCIKQRKREGLCVFVAGMSQAEKEKTIVTSRLEIMKKTKRKEDKRQGREDERTIFKFGIIYLVLDSLK